MIIETDRLLIRKYEDKDKTRLYSIITDTEINQRTGMPKIDENNYKDFINEIKKENNFVICLKETDIAIGFIRLTEEVIDSKYLFLKQGERELSFFISRDYWKKGYLFEAGSKIIDYYFSNCETNKIYAGCYIDNIAAFRSIEKLGFQLLTEKECPYLYDNNPYEKKPGRLYYLEKKITNNY